MTNARTAEFMAHPEVVAFVAEHPTLEPILRRAFRFGYALARADAAGLDEVPVREYLQASVERQYWYMSGRSTSSQSGESPS